MGLLSGAGRGCQLLISCEGLWDEHPRRTEGRTLRYLVTALGALGAPELTAPHSWLLHAAERSRARISARLST